MTDLIVCEMWSSYAPPPPVLTYWDIGSTTLTLPLTLETSLHAQKNC